MLNQFFRLGTDPVSKLNKFFFRTNKKNPHVQKIQVPEGLPPACFPAFSFIATLLIKLGECGVILCWIKNSKLKILRSK